mmetsp:Transcript_6928/g.21079  ORF Transcript_6928/g.21079 Transcript_6928/m.21079 type:complete len:549 (+) Transcript_6928:58-1704(+)
MDISDKIRQLVEDDDLGAVADEVLADDEVEEDDDDGIVRQHSSFLRLSDNSWVSVESEYDSQGDNVFFAAVDVEDEDKKRSHVLTEAESGMAKASNVEGKSVLDCVVDLLRGMRAMKKKSLFRTPSEKWIWLGDDLASLMWKSKKKPDSNGRINLTKCRILKSQDSSITFILDRKKLVLTLNSLAEVQLWITGLSCLVPRDTKVLMGSQLLKERLNYDPLRDSWRGKPISTRKRVNEYILLGGIGKGAFGKVKLAISTLDKKFYAVKIVNKQRNGSFLTETNKEEIAVLRKLHHPHIVRHRDVLYEEKTERIVLVVEYVARGVVMDSKKLVGVKPIGEAAAKEIMRDVVSALLYLHAQHVVHRDIKPDNLLRAGDGTVKLGDFGEARMYDVIDPDNRVKPATPGTPAFLAPEFCMSERSPKPPPENYAADIWSLGATVFYMVFGRAPFLAGSVFELYDVICSEKLKFPPNSKVGRKLKDLLKMMLTKEPGSRATLKQIANHGWFEEPIKAKHAEKIKITEADISGAIRMATWVYPDKPVQDEAGPANS